MDTIKSTIATIERQVAQVAKALQQQRTGYAPQAVTVVLSEDTLVITMHDALTPAEKALALNSVGASQIQEFHRQLFLASADELRKEIKRITGREVREAAAEVVPATGTIVHAFSTGHVVQVFPLSEAVPAEISDPSDAAA